MSEKKVSNINLERFLIGELPYHEMEEIRKMAETDNTLKKRIIEIQKSNSDLFKKYNSTDIARQIEIRYKNSIIQKSNNKKDKVKQLFSQKSMYLFPLAASVALMMIFVSPALLTQAEHQNYAQENTLRFKGERSKLYIYIQRKDSIELLSADSVVYAGDRLQVAFFSDAKYGMIFSIDGSGSVTLHYPREEQIFSEIPANNKIKLPYSYELDAAPGFEKFFFLTSEKEIHVAKILKKAYQFAKDPELVFKDNITTDESIFQTTVRLIKGKNR